jgi:hypothetical protein
MEIVEDLVVVQVPLKVSDPVEEIMVEPVKVVKVIQEVEVLMLVRVAEVLVEPVVMELDHLPEVWVVQEELGSLQQ